MEEELFRLFHRGAGYMHRLHRQQRGFELERGQGRLLRLLAKKMAFCSKN